MFGIKTAADATEMLDKFGASIKKAADEGHFEKIYDLTLEHARFAGVLFVFEQYEHGAAHMDDRVAEGKATEMDKLFVLQGELGKLLARGADDQWSGSGNERQRAIHRGKCEAVDSLLWDLRKAAEDLRA